MLLSDELKKKLENKHILLDTCVLGNILKAIKSGSEAYNDLLSLFESESVVPVINQIINLEFLRDSKDMTQLRDKREFIGQICETSLLIDESILKHAVGLSNVYTTQTKSKHVDLGDLLNTGCLIKYNSNLVLMTENHKDFPLKVHDRIGHLTIDMGHEQLYTYSFYQINLESYQESIFRFSRIK